MATHVQAPDGTTIEFPDSMKDQDIEAAMAKLYPKPGPSVMDQVKQAGSEVLNAPKRFMDWATGEHPIDALTEMGTQFTNARRANQQRALDAFKSGDIKQGLVNSAFSVPFIGPMAQGIGEESKTAPVLAGIHAAEMAAPLIGAGGRSLAVSPGIGDAAAATRAFGRAALPKAAGAGAMMGGAELAGQIPGMEWPARIAMAYPAGRMLVNAGKEGIGAARGALAERAMAREPYSPPPEFLDPNTIIRAQEAERVANQAGAAQRTPLSAPPGNIAPLAVRNGPTPTGTIHTPPEPASTPAARSPLWEGVTVTPRASYAPVESIQGQLPSGRVPGTGIPKEAPVALPAPQRTPLYMQSGIQPADIPDLTRSSGPTPEGRTVVPPGPVVGYDPNIDTNVENTPIQLPANMPKLQIVPQQPAATDIPAALARNPKALAIAQQLQQMMQEGK